MKIQCEACHGKGYFEEHAVSHFAHPEDECDKYGCPVQITCQSCYGAGFLNIEDEKSKVDSET